VKRELPRNCDGNESPKSHCPDDSGWEGGPVGKHHALSQETLDTRKKEPFEGRGGIYETGQRVRSVDDARHEDLNKN
jgi:hypothetical protein